ncbi:MAG: F0F1 ATP synthase subunit delta [Hyphomicrobiales bacterium]|nr:F0F1 ATP synthase subunit delta [Hyphomicrobiales bacterium]
MTDRTASISGVAQRYASALFELARDESALEGVEADLVAFRGLLNESTDLSRLVSSPVFSAEDQERAIGAVADKAGITGLVGNLVRLIARNRRLFTLPDIIKGFQAMLADHRGEITADVVSARPLSDAQTKALKAAMKASLGKDVTIDSRVEPAILGGLIVKVGSRMIDSSIRTKLNIMKSRLKEAS